MCARVCGLQDSDCNTAGGEMSYDDEGCCKCIKPSFETTTSPGGTNTLLVCWFCAGANVEHDLAVKV